MLAETSRSRTTAGSVVFVSHRGPANASASNEQMSSAEQCAPRFLPVRPTSQRISRPEPLGENRRGDQKKKGWPVKINHRRPSRRHGSSLLITDDFRWPDDLIYGRTRARLEDEFVGLTSRRKHQDFLAKKARLALSQ